MGKQRLPGRRDVMLVAHEPPNTEHLGIRVVAAGLAEAGFRPHVLPVGSPSNLAAVVSEALATQPFLVGVSISDPLVAPLLLAFVRLLRQRGFAGHITAGGALATLERGKLLADHPAIDSVVRHAGEAVIVELARALGEGGNLDEVPGLTTRLGEGRGNPAAFTSSRLRPLRAEQAPTLIGIPKADVAASRGCAGRCAYCGVSALERDLDNERQLLGLPASTPRGSIHRPVDDLADEVALLYHDRSVRVVQVVDDNVLGPDPRAARAWLAELEAALLRRRVGTMAWRLMAEPSVLSDEVADAFARLGVLSVLVGIESLTPRGKSALGRRGTHADDMACLQRLAGRGISPLLNVLALRPEGTLADTRAELDGLAQLDDFAWEVVPLTVWPGTALAGQLAAKGQLVGQGAGLAWLPSEPETERFLFALNRLRMGGLAWVTRLPGAVDAIFALRVAHRLGLPGGGRGQVDQAQAFLAQAQRVRRSILEQALALATSSLSAREFGQAVEALHQQAANQLAPFDERFACLLDEVSWPDTHATAQRPARRLASPWLAHGLMMAMATGAAGSGSCAHDPNPPIADAATEPVYIVLPDGPVGTPVPVDTQPLPHMTCTPDGGQSTSLDASCDFSTLANAVRQATNWYCDAIPSTSDAAYAVVIDCDGRAIELLTLPGQTPLLSGAERQAWLDSLANDRWLCFAGQSVQFTCMVCLFPP
jgi:methylmalonyl-CoA mutase cobalamin-binding subunit